MFPESIMSQLRKVSSEPHKSGRSIKLRPFGPPCDQHEICTLVPQEMRITIYKFVETLNQKQQKVFVENSVVVENFGNPDESRFSRHFSNEYHLKWAYADFKVCRTLFVSTTGLSPWTVRNWLGQNAKYNQVLSKKKNQKNEPAPVKKIKIAGEGSYQQYQPSRLPVIKEELPTPPPTPSPPAERFDFKKMLIQRFYTEH